MDFKESSLILLSYKNYAFINTVLHTLHIISYMYQIVVKYSQHITILHTRMLKNVSNTVLHGNLRKDCEMPACIEGKGFLRGCIYMFQEDSLWV